MSEAGVFTGGCRHHVPAAVLALAAAVFGLQKELIAQQKDEAIQTVERKTGNLSALRGRFDQLQAWYNKLNDENARLRLQLGLPALSSSATGAPGLQQMYLGEINVVGHDGKSGTAGWDSGLRTINQIQYGHSIAMNAGCQSGDSGDFWDVQQRRVSGGAGGFGDWLPIRGYPGMELDRVGSGSVTSPNSPTDDDQNEHRCCGFLQARDAER